jgi:DoxX-like family
MMSIEEMNQGSTIQLPGPFLRFIGTCEVLGGLAMVLPGLLKIRTSLTPLVAAGLVIIMIGATWITIAERMSLVALIPFTVSVLAAFVAYGRWRVLPLQSTSAKQRWRFLHRSRRLNP